MSFLFSGDDPSHFDTLAAARADFFYKLDDGTTCACCGRYGRRYRRKMNSSMAASLVALVTLSEELFLERVAAWKPGQDPPDKWVHADAVGRALKAAGTPASYPHGEMGKLAHWGLIEAQPSGTTTPANGAGGPATGPNGEHAGRASGLWRPTEIGIDFVMRRASARRTVILWDNNVEGFEGDEVTIDDVLGDYFNYEELMQQR